jgi:Rad3-related DNA helicase
MSTTSDLDSEIEDVFAAPDFRENQKEIIRKVVECLRSDYEVILLDAPTGFGKSIVLETAARMLGPSFYCTPLNELVDQLNKDEFVADRLISMKGRNNYECVHPEDMGESVDKAICQRQESFDCSIKYEECNYYSRKQRAMEHPVVVTNLAYLMGESMLPDTVDTKFGQRNTLIVDECQSLEDFAINFIGFTVSKYTVPEEVWNNIRIPDVSSDEATMDVMVDWLEQDVLPVVRDMITYYSSMSTLNEDDLDNKEKLAKFKSRVEEFIDSVEFEEWVFSIDDVVKKNSPNYRKIKFKPVYLDGYLEDLVWDRADNIIISSATIPKGDWVSEMGLSDKKVGRISVGSNFPVENRPVITDTSVGKMTYKERDGNMPKAAEMIKELSEHHEGERGIIHCRGYNMVDKLMRSFRNNGYRDWSRENVFVQEQENRDGSIERWQESDKQIMASVNMAEGIDLEGDKCRWQALLKCKYPNMQDERVDYRVKELGDWDWYNNKAVIQLEQAYGRAVRSKDDEAAFYILDESAIGLIKRNKELFHDWFLEALQE